MVKGESCNDVIPDGLPVVDVPAFDWENGCRLLLLRKASRPACCMASLTDLFRSHVQPKVAPWSRTDINSRANERTVALRKQQRERKQKKIGLIDEKDGMRLGGWCFVSASGGKVLAGTVQAGQAQSDANRHLREPRAKPSAQFLFQKSRGDVMSTPRSAPILRSGTRVVCMSVTRSASCRSCDNCIIQSKS